MNTVTAPSIPEAHIAFAKACAALAEASGIDRFQLTYRPSFESVREMQNGQHISGDLRIDFHAKDGRGRPSRNLAVTLSAVLVHSIETTPESCG